MDALETLAGQTAIVTGANRGIGAAVAQGLAELGCHVYAGVRDVSALEGVEAASAGRIRPLGLDVTDDHAVAAAVEDVIDVAGRLDILVNNAGIGDWHGSTLADLDVERFDAVMATNLRGPTLLCQAALPHLLERRGGRIVNISSGMGALTEGMSGSAPAYRISKAALNALSVYLHGEYHGQGLLANSVCPGWVRTDMGGANASRSVAEGADTPLWLCRLPPGGPSGRFWRDRHVIDW